MTITTSPEAEKRLGERAQAEGLSVEAYIERLVREDEEWGQLTEVPIAEDDPDFHDVKAAATEGLQQAKSGAGRAAVEVFAELRARHGILR